MGAVEAETTLVTEYVMIARVKLKAYVMIAQVTKT